MGATEIYLSRPWLAHYEPGMPADVEVPLKTVAQAFDELTARAPERAAVVFYGRAITYRELRDAPDVYWLQELLKNHPPEAPAVTFDPRVDLAALPYTGGTTGSPKGVMLTHYNLMAAQISGQAAFPNFEPGKEVILAFLPFFHIYG